jgi:hypothetical protein
MLVAAAAAVNMLAALVQVVLVGVVEQGQVALL